MAAFARHPVLPPAARLPAPGPAAEPRGFDASALLTSGGDARIALDGPEGLNRYGCAPRPDPARLAFGSSTASTISASAFAAVERLAGRLAEETAAAPAAEVYAEEMQRIRSRLTGLLGLSEAPGLRTVISPSGTDLHRVALALTACAAAAPPLVILPEPQETGGGVTAALGGQLGPAAALRAVAAGRSPQDALLQPQVMTAPSRRPDGALRPAHEVDEDVCAIASAAARLGRKVLLVLMDVSKTGLIAPSVACAADLRQRFPDQLEVMVDACQFRLAPSTLAAYLKQGFMVALTGSKFMTGPAFSGALLAPESAACGAHDARLAGLLGASCARAELPEAWNGAAPARANFGLLLRWEAALEEMRRFLALPPAAVAGFFAEFAAVIGERLAADSAFEALPGRALERTGLGAPVAWDRVQTIFPFLLRAGGRPLGTVETLGVQRMAGLDLGDWAGWPLAARRAELGQPVPCGQRKGQPLAALRLCLSARLAVQALAPGGCGGDAVIDDALDVLDKTAWLAGRLAPA